MGDIRLPESPQPTLQVVGLGHYKPAQKGINPGTHIFELVAEPNNPHDNTAISVRHKGKVIGYIPAAETHKYWDNVIALKKRGDKALVKADVSEDAYGNKSISLYLKPGTVQKSSSENQGCMKPLMWFVLVFIVVAIIL